MCHHSKHYINIQTVRFPVRPGAARITDSALGTLIGEYCREAGVRALKKQLEKIYRKVALRLVKRGASARVAPGDAPPPEPPAPASSADTAGAGAAAPGDGVAGGAAHGVAGGAGSGGSDEPAPAADAVITPAPEPTPDHQVLPSRGPWNPQKFGILGRLLSGLLGLRGVTK